MPSPPKSRLLFRPAIELAAKVGAGALDAEALLEESLGRIAAIDGEIGAFVHVDADGARASAGAGRSGPLAGVPVAVKDIVPVAGWPLTAGSSFIDVRSELDAHAVAALRRAGAVLVGSTKTPELGILAVTEPRRHGPTRNPWQLARSPGGSSGGSAAAVAAGMVALAHGTDGGGSLRVPAACCGVVGLKPSRGRISHAPLAGESYLATDGPIARCAADAALALEAMAGYVPGDASWAPPEPGGFVAQLAHPPERLRVAVTTVPPFDAAVDPLCAAAAARAAELLAGLGHEVVEAAPAWRAEALRESFSTVWCGLTSQGVRAAEALAGRPVSEGDVEPLTWVLHERGSRLSAGDWLDAIAELQAYARAVVASFAAFDVLVTPATAQRPPAIGAIDSCGPDPLRAFDQGWELNPFCPAWNVTGQPALSLPIDLAADGMPLAVQLVGRPLADGPLLSLAAQLEQAAPWQGREPG